LRVGGRARLMIAWAVAAALTAALAGWLGVTSPVASATPQAATATTRPKPKVTTKVAPTTTAAPTTVPPSILIDAASGAAPASGGSAGATGSDASAAPSSSLPNSNRTGHVVTAVIFGLLLVAILLSGLTFLYWRHTEPKPPGPPPGGGGERFDPYGPRPPGPSEAFLPPERPPHTAGGWPVPVDSPTWPPGDEVTGRRRPDAPVTEPARGVAAPPPLRPR
jgi:hypothetical protein